jgi:acetylglutamate kinase
LRITAKLGGSILEDSDIRARILSQVGTIAKQGHEVILVHGGGKSLNRRLSQMQMESRFAAGLRVTDAETLEVAVMVLSGEVNKRLVSELGRLGTRAIGLSGADAAAVECVDVSTLPGYPSGIGFVGKPVNVNRSFFEMILKAGLVPVVSSIALDQEAQLYNVNADQMAAACAWGTLCDALVYLTDVPGVRDENGTVLSQMDKADILSLRSHGIISGGMLPKTSSCLEAIDFGVGSVHIVPGADPDILIKFAQGTLTEGTKIHGKN